MALRAFWQHTSRQGEVDRIEIHDPDFGGTAFELCGSPRGFTFKHDIVTSESNEALLNVHSNRIQVGKLDFSPLIDSIEAETLLKDIRDTIGSPFTIRWHKDGTLWWVGTVSTRVYEYPEKTGNFIAKIRATDFEVLKSIDFPLQDNRQTIITTLSDIFSQLPVPLDIVTRTSWTEEHLDINIDVDYDIIGEVYHETKALRNFADTDDGTDRPITYFDALVHTSEAGLFVRQHGGKIYLEQLTALKDPQSVYETVYNPDGTVQVATAPVIRQQQGFISVKLGTPAVKVTSTNESYPAIKRAKVTFNHRSDISSTQFPSEFRLDSTPGNNTRAISNTIVSDGTQTISLTGSIQAQVNDIPYQEQPGARVEWELSAGSYYWDNVNEEWSNSAGVITNNEWLPLDTILGTGEPGVPQDRIYEGSFGPIETAELPEGADGILILTVHNALSYTTAEFTDFTDIRIEINNQVGENDESDSNSIDYQLTQVADADQIYEGEPTWYGDGPSISAPSQLRYGAGQGSVTSDSWGRRDLPGVYRNFHFNLLKEVMDMQRFNTRKIEADIWGAYDPTKVFTYDNVNYFYAGGTYNGVIGRWQVTLMKVSMNVDDTDTFEEIINFDAADNGLVSDVAYNALTIAQQSREFNRSQKITTTSGRVAGSITEIPIVPVNDVFITKGDVFYIFDIRSANLHEFTLARAQKFDDTTLIVEEQFIDPAIPIGSWIIYTGGQISSYVTRTDTAIKLGVSDWEPVEDDAGNVLTDEDGNPIISSDVDQGSQITLLREQITIKVQNDGSLALVRLDASAETGSRITLQADNIDLVGLVTAINEDTSGQTTIDGGKITAESKITVGTGNNVAVLDGEHPTYRIYAGNIDPLSAPFRVRQDGTVEATKVITLEGEVDEEGNFVGFFDKLNMRDLNIEGQLFMEDTGTIVLEGIGTIQNDGFFMQGGDDSSNITPYKISMGYSAASGIDDAEIYVNNQELIIQGNGLGGLPEQFGRINLVGMKGSNGIDLGNVSGGIGTININAPVIAINPTATTQINNIFYDFGSPKDFDSISIINYGDFDIEFEPLGNIALRGSAGLMVLQPHSGCIFKFFGGLWYKGADIGD